MGLCSEGTESARGIVSTAKIYPPVQPLPCPTPLESYGAPRVETGWGVRSAACHSFLVIYGASGRDTEKVAVTVSHNYEDSQALHKDTCQIL